MSLFIMLGLHLNFITGAGGFIQNIFNGYAGLRAREDQLEFTPLLPPHIDMVRLRRIRYGGAVFTMEYNDTIATLTLSSIRAGSKIGIVGGDELVEGVSVEVPAARFSLAFIS